MESREIDRLLEAYWAGESSQEEEARLEQYLLSAEVVPRYREAAAMFAYYRQQRMIRRPNMQEDYIKSPGRSMVYLGMKIAAAILLFAAITTAIVWQSEREASRQDEVAMTDTFEDPEQAYEAVREALLLVSSQMNATTKRKPLHQLKQVPTKILQLQDRKTE